MSPAGSRAAGAPPVWSLDAPGALTALGSSRRGLSEDEAARRRLEGGRNELPPARPPSVLAEVAAQLTNMFAVILLVSAGLTLLTYLLSVPRDPANLELTFGILAVVALNAVIGFSQEHAAERTAATLQTMVPRSARVVRAGNLVEVPAEELVPGDVVVLEAGDAVSADARVVEAHELTVELATLTGESQPVVRTTDPVAAGTAAQDARNCVFMGTTVAGGTGKAVVFATGAATEFGRVYRLTAGLRTEQSPLQRQVADMARRVASVAVAVGGVLFATRVATGHPAVATFVFALAVMVALVPEGLPATLSVSLAVGVRRMAEHKALIRRLAAVEALGSTTVVCTDKTGTLTTAEMTVQQVYGPGGLHAVTGAGYSPEGAVERAGEVAGTLRAAALCCDARLVPPAGRDGWRVLGDTTEGAILVAAAKAGVDVVAEARASPRVAVFPFDAERKVMTTVHRVGDAFEAYVKGSPQAVLQRCASARCAGGVRPLDPALRDRVDGVNDALAGQALRVLAVASRAVGSARVTRDEAEEDLTFLGLLGMADPPRPEVTAAVDACRRAGIRLVMVTGDYGLTAEAVARRVGIVDGPARVVTGSDLDALDDGALGALLGGDVQVLFARVRPEHKLRLVDAFERRGEVVAVTGDGVNDAPALKRAGIGVAMGRSGTDVARAAAVMVLLDDSFASISAAVELGRSVYQNIRHVLVYIFSHNLAELAPILAAVVLGFPLVPLTALQVLSIDLGSDVLPGLALGTERPEPDTMDRPPRPTSEHLFSWSVVRRFLFLGSIESVGVVFAFFWKINSAHLPYSAFTAATPTYREAITLVQVGIIVSQFFNLFAVRSDRESIFAIGLLSNRPLVGAALLDVAVAVAVSYLPPLQHLFGTAPLSVADWLVLVGFGALLLAADELRKAGHRLAGRRRAGAAPPAGGGPALSRPERPGGRVVEPTPAGREA